MTKDFASGMESFGFRMIEFPQRYPSKASAEAMPTRSSPDDTATSLTLSVNVIENLLMKANLA
jgi:hypothetical protein